MQISWQAEIYLKNKKASLAQITKDKNTHLRNTLRLFCRGGERSAPGYLGGATIMTGSALSGIHREFEQSLEQSLFHLNHPSYSACGKRAEPRDRIQEMGSRNLLESLKKKKKKAVNIWRENQIQETKVSQRHISCNKAKQICKKS